MKVFYSKLSHNYYYFLFKTYKSDIIKKLSFYRKKVTIYGILCETA